MFAHHITGCIPNREQDTLALMVTCPVGVRFAEISECDGPINCREDLRKANVGGFASEYIPAPHTSFRTNNSCAFERKQDLLEVWLGECGALGNVSNRGWAGVVSSKSEGEQCPTGIVTPC